MTKAKEIYVGIDIGKTWLDVAIWGEEEVLRVRNDASGITELLTHLEKWKPELIALEATGGYEQEVVQAMILKGYKVAVVNPTRIRALAKALGKLAKTDKIDAHLIAEYAYRIRPKEKMLKEENEMKMRALVTRREQLVEMRVAEQNRLGTAHSSMKMEIRKHIEWMEAQIEALEQEMQLLVVSMPEWQAQSERLDTIPGVGFITAITIVAEMPELGQLNRQEIASLAGLAPFNRDSGKKRGKRRIFGGRKGVRRVLYMACLSATKCNGVIRETFNRLTSKGKIFKVAMTACMRKMLTICNAMARDQVDWKAPGSSLVSVVA